MRELSSREWKQALVAFYTQNLNFWLLENLDGNGSIKEAKAKAYADSIKVKNYPFSPNGAEIPEDIKTWFVLWLDELADKKEQEPAKEESLTEADVERMIAEAIENHIDESNHLDAEDVTHAVDDAIDDLDFEGRIKSVLRDIVSDF